MKRFAVTVPVLVALTLSSAALAGGTLVGKFSTRIVSPGELKGTWVLNFAKAGTYTVADSGKIVIHGRYSVTGSKVTFSHETGPAACAHAGKYTWARSGKRLKFTRVSDATACSGRSVSHTFTQVS
jgi:hypothetical protein